MLNYEHLPVDSPYRMRFAIFVRQGEETYDKVDEVPEQLQRRVLAVRAFDANGMMTGFELVELLDCHHVDGTKTIDLSLERDDSLFGSHRAGMWESGFGIRRFWIRAVSYTHLTLPTICSV